ncbi:MAG: HEAT repeat domain-containing protein [Myxococcales bacterium]|nr:HEAT repeat domain-containing protein [Myxococcales bacterium]
MSYLLPSNTITLEAALHDIGHGSPRARALAAHALGDATGATAEEAAQVHDALLRALTDSRLEVRAEAAASLGAIGAKRPTPQVIAALIAAIDDQASPVRQAALIALGAIGDRSAFPALLAASSHELPDVRYQAITSLAEIDPASAYDHVIAALADQDPQVVAAAALALGAIGDGRAAGHLSRLLEHHVRDVQLEAACALAELHDDRGVEILRGALAREQEAMYAIDALATLATPAAGDALATALTMRGAFAVVAVCAAGALLATTWEPPRPASEAEAARQVLLANATRWKLQLREAALGQIERVGGTWAIAALRDFARSWQGWPARKRIHGAINALSAQPA